MAEIALSPARPARSPVADLGRVLVTARSPRFRASTWHHLRTAAKHGAEVVILAAAVDATWLLPGHPDEALRVAGANLLAGGVALATWLLVVSRHRAPVEALLFGVLLAVDASIAVVIGIDVEVSLIGAGYVLLLPPVVALLVPWNTRVHLAWLITHAIVAGALSLLVPPEAHAIGGPRTLMGLLVVATSVSVLGHFANLRARVASFNLIEQIRSMNRQARRDHVRLRRLNVLLDTMARTDELTGVGNRVGLQHRLATMRSRVDRHGERFVLLVVDLDHFKAINDTLGHFAGDDVLRRVAQAIVTSTRAADSTYRLGGEEFVAVIALRRAAEAATVAERARSRVEALAIEHPANPPFGCVTVSVGGSVVDRSRLAEADDAWLRCADRALYEAKARGRNRSVIA